MSAQPGVIRRASACACGGRCPRCKSAKVGAHDDPLEREAEKLADQVTTMSAAGVNPQPPSATPAPSGSNSFHPEVRAFFEPRFGRSFEHVRVHTGPEASARSEELHARAFTLGSDIWFNRGQYDPASPRGQHLLAHELAHVAQTGAADTIRRFPWDFEVNDLPARAASDTNQIYFDRASTAIPVIERVKIKALATPANGDLTLHGQSSEDTPLASQAAEINARLDAVEAALKAEGHTGKRVRKPHPGEGTGHIDYRGRRSVSVLPTPAGLLEAPNPKNACGAPGAATAKDAELKACTDAFDDAFDKTTPHVKEIVDKAEKDVVTTPTAAANAVVTQFFGGVPRAAINNNVTAIAKQVRQLRARHRCHTTCDSGCDRPAYNKGSGLGVAGAILTICPDFVGASHDFRVDTLIHEASHANPLEPVTDVAYANTRLIPFLMPAVARGNTDSYVLLMRLVHKAGSKSFGQPTPDVLKGMTGVGPGSDTEKAQRSVAWLESWLNYGSFDTALLHKTVTDSLAPPGKWIAAKFDIETMHQLATAFPGELTDPGPDGAAPTTPPTERDKLRVAAIHDRFKQMYSVVYGKAINVTRGSPEKWGGRVGLPRMTQDVVVAPAFFALSDVERVKRLVALMVRARSDISGPLEAKYVMAIDLIRTHRKLGA